MNKIFIGTILGIMIQKGLTSASDLSWNYYQRQCRLENPNMNMSESFKCADDRQGLLRYVYIASGTIVSRFGGGYGWRY